MSKSVVRSSLTLILAGIVCKILGGLFRLPLTNILGVKGIGYFQMVMSLYVFTLMVCSGGITIALSKLVADPTNSAPERVNSLYKISIITSLALGVAIGTVFYVFGGQIAKIQGGTFGDTYKLMIILLSLGGIIACFRGVLQGFETMYPTAVSQVIEQGIRFVFGLFFASVFVNRGVERGVYGAFLGIVLAEIVSALYLFFEIKRRKVRLSGRDFHGFYKNLLPILIGSSILPLVNAVDSLIIVSRLSLAGFGESQAVLLFGIQSGVVGTILGIPAMISSSIAIAMLPSVVALKINREQQKQSICTAFEYLWVVLLPMVLGIMAVSRPLYTLLYPSLDFASVQLAVNLTMLGGISSILLAIMQFLITILQVHEKLLYSMILQLVGGGAKFLIVFKFCAVAEINVFGIILGNIFLSSVVIIGGLLKLKEVVQVSFIDLILPLISSVLMHQIVSLFVEYAEFSAFSTLILSTFLGIIIYGILSFPVLREIIPWTGRKSENKFTCK